MTLGVVIPTLNEELTLGALLRDLRELGATVPLDIVVADGGSTDGTRAVAAAAGVRVLTTSRGRASQLNAGALAARGDWLLFLHSDVRLAAEARRAVAAAVAPSSDLGAAVFRFAIELPWPWKPFIELGQRVREQLWGLPYGDQGLLVRRALFERIGGYPSVPLMEDVAIIRRLRRETAIRRLPAKLLTSGRRYVRDGVVRTWLKHTSLIALYSLGVSPHRLARMRDA
ncbi:MAG: TIGR04283 family arsenosugar biosynthesis glycosyltransferase [Gemmatimonadales bacterium]